MNILKVKKGNTETYSTYDNFINSIQEICTGYYDYAVINKSSNPSVGRLIAGSLIIDSQNRGIESNKPLVSTCDDFKNKLLMLLAIEANNPQINKYKIIMETNYYFDKKLEDNLTVNKDTVEFFNSASSKNKNYDADYKEEKITTNKLDNFDIKMTKNKLKDTDTENHVLNVEFDKITLNVIKLTEIGQDLFEAYSKKEINNITLNTFKLTDEINDISKNLDIYKFILTSL